MTNRSRILLIDSDRRFCGAIADCLINGGYQVEVAYCATDALDKALNPGWQAIVLNVDLPELRGLSLLETLRRAGDKTPVLVVTDHVDEADEITMLGSGADDYLSRNGSAYRLLARLRAVTRRTADPSSFEIVVAGLRIMPELNQVTLDGYAVEVTPGEFAVLWSLARTPGQIKTRRQLFAELRHRRPDASERTLDMQVSFLRRKLGDNPRRPRFIRTVHGAGYMLLDPK